ncbi:hypothetical protein [Tunturiibacter gelidoferens]|uniref:Uncharacterized protein n=1 Tax=Tunturiibacter gelidiferens TaxID=3069689 RepID=A0A9X0QB21_9BACT|nr:hypothetical protein [Edaphobacter lichenicola]MBB5327092.1 hypothetical protein [Edaphobacter lichenicola]
MRSLQANVEGSELFGGFRVKPEVHRSNELDENGTDDSNFNCRFVICGDAMEDREIAEDIQSKGIHPSDDQHSESDVCDCPGSFEAVNCLLLNILVILKNQFFVLGNNIAHPASVDSDRNLITRFALAVDAIKMRE